jgi:predicted transcriptional regulator
MTNKTAIALSETLGIEHKPEEKVVEIIPPSESKPSETSNDAEEDYNLARTTFRNLIQQGNLALEDMKELARQSESPRAFEVFSTMMKTISETTKDLYDLQKKTKELKGDKSKPVPDNINIDKAVFVGTTSDLLKKIKEDKS